VSRRLCSWSRTAASAAHGGGGRRADLGGEAHPVDRRRARGPTYRCTIEGQPDRPILNGQHLTQRQARLPIAARGTALRRPSGSPWSPSSACPHAIAAPDSAPWHRRPRGGRTTPALTALRGRRAEPAGWALEALIAQGCEQGLPPRWRSAGPRLLSPPVRQRPAADGVAVRGRARLPLSLTRTLAHRETAQPCRSLRPTGPALVTLKRNVVPDESRQRPDLR
jgi:hypothetical protein